MQDSGTGTENNLNLPAAEADTPERSSNEPYKVGYGRPPLHTRFQKGSQGNGKGGRKKRATTIEEALAAEIAKVIEVRVNGKVKKMTVAEAIAQAVARRAISSDKGALAILKAVHSNAVRGESDTGDITEATSPEHTQRTIYNFLERVAQDAGIPVEQLTRSGADK